MTKEITEAIDAATRELLKDERRSHLGASQIGASCLRQIWYEFHWAYEKDADGQLRRLWSRGHEEEHRFVRWLRAIGCEIRDYTQRLMYHNGSNSYLCIDWDDAAAEEEKNRIWMECDDVSEDQMHIQRAAARRQGPKQWGFTHHNGHYSGKCDGKIRGDNLPEGWGLLECKTHNDKSFKALLDKGVARSKPQHWSQVQVYLHHLELKWCLYIAVNKNDDQIYCEIINYKPEIGIRYEQIALRLINEQRAPQRLSEDPSWYECKWCTFIEICHYEATPEKNCRSCSFVSAVEDKQWRCCLFRQIVPKDFISKGCNDWSPVK